MAKLVNENLDEIYTDRDLDRGSELDNTIFGINIGFKGDYRREKLVIKKLVRFQSQLPTQELKMQLEEILDMISTPDPY